MGIKSKLLLLICLAIVTDATPTPSTAVAAPEKQPTYSTPFKALALVTAVAAVGAGFFAVVSLIFPVIAYHFCYWSGGCSYDLGTYVDRYAVGKQKRSMEYVAPAVEALAAAYELYAGDDGKKNFRTRSYYKR